VSAPSVTPLRGQLPSPGGAGFGDYDPRSPLAAARAARQRDPDLLPADGPVMHPLAARGFAFLALALFGGLHWMQQVEPTEGSRAWGGLGVGLLVAVGLVAAGRLPPLARWAAALAVTAAGVALALIAGGLADEQVLPSSWGEVAGIIGRGIDALPGARIPYRGLDPDLRAIIPLGGTVLVTLAAALAFWPRRRRTGFPIAALIVLVALYAVPAVALIGTSEFIGGALLLLLVIAFLRLERLRRRDAGAAAALAGLVATLALLLAPALDKDEPWWDYESWSQSAAGAKSTSFNWDHDYGPLDWPRDGRELLRINSPNRAYWKADNLDRFDGRHWVRAAPSPREPLASLFDGVELSNLRQWSFHIKVSVRNLRSQTFPIAGTADNVTMPRQVAFPVRPGIYAASRTLHKGDAYEADVYVPQPSDRDLRTAGETYSSADLERYTTLDVTEDEAPEGVLAPLAGRTIPIVVPGFGAEPSWRAPTARPAKPLIDASELSRAYELSRRLLRGSQTPYEYVRAIERYLDSGFSYSEQPPDASRTLDGFLFESRIGYCQQFSGAMALLLRLGGVPARVATGFAPGSLDRRAKQYVVRDVDAHSWVEAWFPGIGWVVFDPTPSTAPPRSQSGTASPSAGLGDVRDLGTQTLDPRLATAAQPEDTPPWLGIIGGVLALIAAVFGLRALRRRRAQLRRAPATFELERALQIAGGGLAPATTLAALESRFASVPPAAGYVRALRAQRYAPSGGAPTPAQRRGLRRALARGGGPRQWLRALRALPPRIRRRPWRRQAPG
jgi:transglutaminase-like putative cysteine protease